ncbi:GAF domain-containing hybrid sensor histidine kinase/response regulator [Microvirga mediterraneensis]|uniref:histidine kinase n=1 Tax=Microvirga mediterraneensis TaxID=2754695 RepID=A0A838BNJ7_9HYPH|nr:PAS domain-containing protein [Microvirga mediterraneensis]MBA1156026.1 PAS domain-containing protein [Microvirga mediterraneensis]
MMDSKPVFSASPGFLSGGGEMGALIRAHDWAATPLGSPAAWPQALKTAVGLMLQARQPIYVAWGAEQISLYNDGYIPILGTKHPTGLGQPASILWAEVWDALEPINAAVFAGEAQWFEDMPFALSGRERDMSWFSYSYTPLRSDDDRIMGIFCAAQETTAKVLTSRRIQAERERLARMYEQAPGFVALLEGPEHRFGLANPAYMQVVGRRDIIGKTIAEALPEAVEQGYVDLLNDVYGSGRALRLAAAKYIIQAGSGEPADERYVDFVYQPLTDAAGAVTGIFVEGYDVTDRVRAETHRRALVELGERIRDIVDPDELSFAAAEILGRTLEVSRAGYGTVDKAAETIAIVRDWNAPGIKTIAGILHFREYGSYIEALKRGETAVIADAYLDPRTAATADMLKGISAQAFINMPVTERGNLVALLFLNHATAREWREDELALVREVAERTRTAVARLEAEQELQALAASLEQQVVERSAEYDRVWRNSRDLLVIVGADGIFRAVNPAWTTILGHPSDEVVGRSFLEFIWPEDAALTQDGLNEAAAAHDLTNFENRYRHKDGTPRWISWHTSVEGDLVYAYGRHITAEKEAAAALAQAQDALRQSQKLEAVGQLTGGVAHDFNNLLTIIKSSTDLLRKPGLPEERRRRYVDAISDTVDRAARLTGQLLAFARRQALKPEVFDASDRIRAITDMLRTVVGSRIRIVVEMASEHCLIEADMSQFETALVNMVVNARDAMNGEGTLTVRVAEASGVPAIRGHRGGTGSFVAVSLTDTGAGIAPDELVRIFEPFFTTKEIGKGTGLGLSQVYGFAKQSGGDVAVESEVGRGTTFTLYLPRIDESVAAGSTRSVPSGSAPEDGRGRRVLVVEDNVEVGRFSTQVLQDLGYETTWAANATEALTLLQRTDDFDVVFSDVVMPGMSGIELGQEIRRRHPHLPVVLTSGYSHVLAEKGRHGFELLQKPYAAEELSRILRRLTGGRHSAR